MDPAGMEEEVVFDLPPVLRVYREGRVERLFGTDFIPTSVDPKTSVESKDVVFSPGTGLSARLYVPKLLNQNQKLPLLVYFHGGGFCLMSPFCAIYHNYLNTLVHEANIVAVSVDYRKAPEHPLPTAYDDSWAALKWVASHVNGDGPEDWLNFLADFDKVYLAGESAGANITHHMGLRYGKQKLQGLKLAGIILIHSYFGGSEPIGAEADNLEKIELTQKLWRLACPGTTGLDDPLFNPAADPNWASLEATRVLVGVAEKDFYRDRGWYYFEKLKESGWGGVVEIVESKGEDHGFHLFNPTCEKALDLLKQIVSFINVQYKS
ncbi:probable carboxylesterase 2 [Mangifera indica]|uniref:probable carboxylesterase 2 n=1 Tax=Mangifera indica TaxID=29780 RepID=UPI001CFB8188|nr:probable carboxylesterase 2 [Mangifera indica]